MIGENPQSALRPAPENVGRLHERGLVDSLLFTTKPAIETLNLILRSAAEGRASRRMGHGRKRRQPPMVRDALRRAPHHEVCNTPQPRPWRSAAEGRAS